MGKRIFKHKKNDKHNSKYCAYFQETLFELLNLLPIKENTIYRFKIRDLEIKIGSCYVIVIYKDNITYQFNNVSNDNDYDLNRIIDGDFIINDFDFRYAQYFKVFEEMKFNIDFLTCKELLRIYESLPK